MKKQLLFTVFLACTFSVFAQVPSYVPTNGLVGWWPFNGNANDESGNGNNGVVNGATLTTDRFGNVNSSFEFDGINDDILVNNDTVFDFPNNLSIGAWIKPNISFGGRKFVVSKFQNWDDSYNFALNNNHPEINFASAPAIWSNYETIEEVSIQSWSFIATTFDSLNVKVYLNGSLVLVSQFDTVLFNSQSPLVFGNFFGNNFNQGCYFNGQIDDIGIWNRALTECEIRNLYSSGIPNIAVFNDVDLNCQSSNEMPVGGAILNVQPGNIISLTDSSGIAIFPNLPDGTYTATVDTTNLNWSPSCGITQSFQVVNGISDCISFGMINDNPCTNPDVSIYAPFLRPCLPNQMIYVQACNQATATGILNASYVDVELDPLMSVTNSSIPYTIQSSNVYRFQTGNLNPGQCTNFSISTTIGSPAIGCASLLGQTLCMDANLYPAESCALDTIPSNPPTTGGGTLNGFPQPCTLPWDQSSLSVDGWCANDSIYFTITNTGDPGGGDMECYSPMWITVDGVVTYTDSIMIPGGQTITLSFPGDGQTWQLNASQHPLHPGNSNPNAYVELCGDSTNFTPGLVNELPLNDADPVVDIYCGMVTAAYDPNDKTGYPTGQTDQKYIQPNQQLQYVIRFQNTGTDTAFTVVIRDTLDTDLNIFTVTPGVASHPYTFKMYGPRVLEWTFDNINLPDSTTDQAGSNGFATFHVEQVPNLAPGTVINNDADIYFDFNAPITTNTTVHRIYEGFVSVAALEEMIASKPSILVYPNPTSGSFTIRMDKASAEHSYRIFDQQGRTVKTGNLDGKQTTLELNGLSGMYYLLVGQEVVKVQVVR